MRNLHVFGEYVFQSDYIAIQSNSCITYDTNTNDWNCISEMNIARVRAACTVVLVIYILWLIFNVKQCLFIQFILVFNFYL